MNKRQNKIPEQRSQETNLDDPMLMSTYLMNPFLLDYFEGNLKFDQLCVVLNGVLATWPDHMRYPLLGRLVSDTLRHPKLSEKILRPNAKSLPKKLKKSLARVVQLVHERDGLSLSNPNEYPDTAYHAAAKIFTDTGLKKVTAGQAYARYREYKDQLQSGAGSEGRS